MAYKYKVPTQSTNFISRYVRYASSCCDAAHEYHEAHALNLLSAAAFGLKLKLPIHPNGLRPNLYFLIVGESSFTRKSTAMKIAMDIQRRAFPSVRMPSSFTPGGFESSLEEISPGPALIFADEFKGMFIKMHKLTYMSGIREMLLSFYDDDYYVYRRSDKKGQTDSVLIEDISLSLIGNITPSFIGDLTMADIEDGFLARHAIVFPQEKPPRIPLDKIPSIDNKIRNKVIMHLSKLFERMIALDGVDCEITDNGMKALDDFVSMNEKTKASGVELTMFERLSTMVIKVAMLISIGEVDVDVFTNVKVTSTHVDQAIKVVRKWREGAGELLDRVGNSKFEDAIGKIHRKLKAEKELQRSYISRAFKLSRRVLDDVQFTMIERNMINLKEVNLNGSPKATLFWVLKEEGAKGAKV